MVEPFLYSPLDVSIERRLTLTGHVLLVFNESFKPASPRFRFTTAGRNLPCYDHETGIGTVLRRVVRVPAARSEPPSSI